MNPFKRKTDSHQTQGIILDTCALIDARIVDIAKAGFVPRQIIIPQFVIAELQFLADHGDSHKRERARHGLDIIRDLQELRRSNVSIAREQFENIKEVDDKLIALAKVRSAMLYTTDYNLNKVAQIEGVTVLNVNELAHALRPRRLPGEQIELKITQQGQDKTQGVGYLDDGTMVVVERAGNKVGQKISVEFSRMLQTQAGKMMFAVLPQHQQSKQQHKIPTINEPKQKEFKAKKQPETQLKPMPPKATPTVYHAAPRKKPVTKAKSPVKSHDVQQTDQSQTNKPSANKQRKIVPPKLPQTSGASRSQYPRKKRSTPEDALIKALEHLQ